MKLHRFSTPHSIYDIRYIGPHSSEGPLPAVFYFVLSAEESLMLDPFNQPAQALLPFPLRIFSITIPCHEEPYEKEEAMTYWREAALEGNDLLTPFFSQVSHVVKQLFAENIVTKCGFMGLSRGGFVALHIAALLEEIEFLSLFAPMTDLQAIVEFSDLPSSFLDRFSPVNVAKSLAKKRVRISMGNADKRVGTKSAITFFQHLCQSAVDEGIRLPNHELHVVPSIGYRGHGTDQKQFIEGALWLKDLLLPK